MKRAENIQNELNELNAKALLEASGNAPFAMPSNYFESLSTNLLDLAKISENADPEPNWSKTTPYKLPSEHYFEHLGHDILNKVNTDIQPEWSKEIPYSVPNNYFEQLPEIIVSKAKQKTITHKPRRISIFRNVQLAASVALIIFVGLGVLQLNPNSSSRKVSLMGISNAEITNYVNQNIDDFDTDMIINNIGTGSNQSIQNVNNTEIQEYLDNEGW